MQPAYEEFNGKVCISASVVMDAEIGNLPLWKKWMREAKRLGYVTRPGGNGRTSLIELTGIPSKYRDLITNKFGQPDSSFNALEEYFTMDAEARLFFVNFRHPETGKALEPYQVNRYTINASVLKALIKLREAREALTRMKGNPRRDLKPGLANDAVAFNNVLKNKYHGAEHNLPKHPRKLADKMAEFKRTGYACLIDGRQNNPKAKVTPEMVQLWNDMFAGRRHKPTHIEVANEYRVFLLGKKAVVNSDTGELYDPTCPHFVEVCERTVFNWLSETQNRAGVFKKRSGNRKGYMDEFTPSARMLRPTPGSIISVDDFQPPFKWAPGEGNRMWFYIAQDLGSEAITAWTFGESKEGIITEFYRQIARQYCRWGVKLPSEIECELSLNSSLTNTVLAPGVMFQKARILPNKPRAKKIERTIRELRLTYARKHPAFVARPDAADENYQSKPGKQQYISKDEIVQFELGVIQKWNNSLHPDQATYPNLTRWQVFKQHQNPKLLPTNWIAILLNLGHRTPTSMRRGRIRLQGRDCVVGFNGQVALGTDLINVWNEIEGEEVIVHWLDDDNGQVLKAAAYTHTGRFICEVLDDLPFHRAEIDKTEQCHINERLYYAYENTIESHSKRIAKSVNAVDVIDLEEPQQGEFQIPGLRRYETTEAPVTILPNPDNEPQLPNHGFGFGKTSGFTSDNY